MAEVITAGARTVGVTRAVGVTGRGNSRIAEGVMSRGFVWLPGIIKASITVGAIAEVWGEKLYTPW
jgi:hypothetical protein